MLFHDPIQKVDDDQLNAVSLAAIILGRLSNNDCPSTLGLYGGWGTGKSSIINLMVQLNLEEKSINGKSLSLEIFDAWQYDSMNNLIAPIITRMLKPIKNWDKFSHVGLQYAERIFQVTTLAISDIAIRKLTGLNLEDVQKYKTMAEKPLSIFDWEQTIDEIEQTKNAFDQLVSMYLYRTKKDKLVLCIDNLDRCSPENVVKLLESVKNFLAVQNCIWLFSIENNVVASYIDKKYEGTKMDGNRYLDKIIPEQYHIAQPTYDQAQQLVEKILKGKVKLGDFARTSRFLIPRRLIKAAVKYSQIISTTNNDSIYRTESAHRKETLLALILLYHEWPDFYEYLSSGSDEHIMGTLQNFIPNVSESWEKKIGQIGQKVPLPQKYLTDGELNYFIQAAFFLTFRQNVGFIVQDNLVSIIGTLPNWIRILRQVGLP